MPDTSPVRPFTQANSRNKQAQPEWLRKYHNAEIRALCLSLKCDDPIVLAGHVGIMRNGDDRRSEVAIQAKQKADDP